MPSGREARHRRSSHGDRPALAKTAQNFSNRSPSLPELDSEETVGLQEMRVKVVTSGTTSCGHNHPDLSASGRVFELAWLARTPWMEAYPVEAGRCSRPWPQMLVRSADGWEFPGHPQANSEIRFERQLHGRPHSLEGFRRTPG